MEKELFDNYCKKNFALIQTIKDVASSLHESVNQKYDENLPYGFHLSMVANAVIKYGNEIIEQEKDIIPAIFAAYFHDSIEDARLTYNDVMKTAKQFMNEEQAYTATEIVYALTNDKGRTRAERAGEKYYEGIRTTPFAPFIKLSDRCANMSYSFHGTNKSNTRMFHVYVREWGHFISAISVDTSDRKYLLPQALIKEIITLIKSVQ